MFTVLNAAACTGLNEIMHISNTVSLSNLIFPMNGMFNLSNEPHNEHGPTKCQTPALAARHQKINKKKQAYTQ